MPISKIICEWNITGLLSGHKQSRVGELLP
jgi:hypothetical protein